MAASDLGGLCVVGAVLLYVCIASFLPCRRSDETLQPDNFAAQAPDKNVVESELVVEIWHPQNDSTKQVKDLEKGGAVDKVEDEVELQREQSKLSSVLQIDNGSSLDDNCCLCSICLDSFHDGDFVARSNNKKCTHLFHRDCIVGWLLTRNECPMCRQTFLVLPRPKS